MTASIYKFLVSDFLNPALIPSGDAGSADEFVFASSCIEAILIFLIQLFFCWRLWVISMASLRIEYILLFIGLTVSLALLSFASSMDLAVNGSDHHLLSPNTPSLTLAYKLSTSTRVAFDVMVTIAMSIALVIFFGKLLTRPSSEALSLHHARSMSDVQHSRIGHVFTLLTLFTVNTNLITTCLSISELVTFLTLPNAAVYGGIAFLTAKTYLHSFLAVLNSREYLREKIRKTPPSTTFRRGGRLAIVILPEDKLSVTAAGGSSSFQPSIFNYSDSKPNISDSDMA